MSRQMRIYAVIEDRGEVLCGSPEFHNGHIFTRTELNIKLEDDNTIVRDSELYEYFDKFLNNTLEGLEAKNE